MPVVTLQEGTTVDSPGVKAELAAIDERLREALPGWLETRQLPFVLAVKCTAPSTRPISSPARR